MSKPSRIDIDINQPRFDQNTYIGRFKHFFLITNPLNLLATETQLEDAKCIVTRYRLKQPLHPNITEEDIWRAKVLYDSAFHPDTGEKMNLIGRMSAQVPMNVIITAGMMTYYKSTSGVLFWQWFNQSFNALVNFTNRSGDATFTTEQIVTSYVCATTGAVATSLYLNRLCRKAPPLIGRFVPLAAVIVANVINISLMRWKELRDGTPVYDSKDNKVGYSKKAGQKGITQVILSRVFMAIPGMTLTPVIMDYLERRGTLRRHPWMNLPAQMGIVAMFLVVMTPAGCSLFKQRAQIASDDLEPELKEELQKKFGKNLPDYVFFNKGL